MLVHASGNGTPRAFALLLRTSAFAFLTKFGPLRVHSKRAVALFFVSASPVAPSVAKPMCRGQSVSDKGIAIKTSTRPTAHCSCICPRRGTDMQARDRCRLVADIAARSRPHAGWCRWRPSAYIPPGFAAEFRHGYAPCLCPDLISAHSEASRGRFQLENLPEKLLKIGGNRGQSW